MLADFTSGLGSVLVSSFFGAAFSPSHFPAVAFHFSLAAQPQDGAVLVFSTHLVHDLIQSELQAAHPSAHFKQVFFFSSAEYPALQVLHSASLSAQSAQLVTLQATQVVPPATGPNLSLQVVQVSLEHFKQSFPQV